ncbi:MAG TPA: peptidoglycan DD-metalloendopeptidase family protein [Ferruginibacter sp.]|nr:peptidoglycan DD-metalloendopeptidase family protein [Ferruginibacter sp.]HRP48798.1 peptidoglycan DD-metalloendopeptidase family protein [Ferruginibacter sp.]
MNKSLFVFVLGLLISITAWAQPTTEQLEKQRQQLRKELEETQRLLKQNQSKQKENLVQWQLISKKVNLQGKVVDNINKDLRALNNDMYTLQKEINLYNRILDTLKKEYAKSMVYAYKNRNSSDFLNFIFSAESFNDAIKRVTYLRSYRNYREMQGQNIIRTQEQRQKKVDALSKMRVKKNETLKIQNSELGQLAKEQQEKDRIVAELKKQGKTLNKQAASKKAQMDKVNKAIAAAIKRAQDEAIRIAKAKAAEEERERRRLEEEQRKRAATTTTTTTAKAPEVKPKPAEVTEPGRYVRKPGESVLLNSDNIELNASFEKNKGSLPWPVDRGTVLMPFGSTKLPSGTVVQNYGITVSSEVGAPVKSIFNGTVSSVTTIEDMQVVMVQHGRYFVSYSNLQGVTVQPGEKITTGKVLGKVAPTYDGIGAIDFIISDEKINFNPEHWLRRR